MEHDLLKTQLQETGRCYAGHLTVADIMELTINLGIDVHSARLRNGWLVVEGSGGDDVEPESDEALEDAADRALDHYESIHPWRRFKRKRALGRWVTLMSRLHKREVERVFWCAEEGMAMERRRVY